MIDRAARMKAVEDKIAEVKALAKQKYGIDLSDLIVRYDLKGRTAGWAIGLRTIRLNTTAIFGDEAHFRDMINDTIGHEVAHILCHRNPSLGDNHNAGWAAVCRALGGTGKRTHDMTTIEFARGRTYIYTSTAGKEYGVSERRHKGIQMGGTCRFRKSSWGYIDRYCAYVVKYNGRVISTHPAQQRPATTMFGGLFTRPAVTPPKPAANLLGGYAIPEGTRVVNAEQPTAPKPVQPATTGGSYAEQVRALIRVAKAAGLGQDHVFRQAVNTLGMKATSARNCVKFNWDRV